MSDSIKKTRKSRAMYIGEAEAMGIVTSEDMTVAELKKAIQAAGEKVATPDVIIPDVVEPIDESKDTGANCEHEYFRQIRIVDPKGNYLVKVCKLCGYKERIV